GITASGTLAHSVVMAYSDEEEAFRRFQQFFPDHSVLLVDTYDTLAAIEKIIHTGLRPPRASAWTVAIWWTSRARCVSALIRQDSQRPASSPAATSTNSSSPICLPAELRSMLLASVPRLP